MLLVHYFESLSDQAIEVFNQFGAGDKVRYIPVHSLVPNLGKSKLQVYWHLIFYLDVMLLVR